MKKILLALFAILTTISLTACDMSWLSGASSSENGSVESSSTVSESVSNTEEVTSEENSEESFEENSEESSQESVEENSEEASSEETSEETHTHVGVKTEAKDATCQVEGNIAYWTCECEKIFSDEACTTEITLADTVLGVTAHSGVKTEAKDATCTEEGNISYWTCECEKIFSDEACTTEITLADTVLGVTAHSGVKTEAKDATCTEEGNIAYWTCECEKIFSDEACTTEITLADTVLGVTAHSGVKTEAKDATCTEEGNIAYWTCECKKIFSDEACTTEITLADTVVAATGHNYNENGACVCGSSLTDKALWVNAGEACETVAYTEGKGWKATAAGEANYTVRINHEVTAYYMEQGNELLTLTFCGAFDGATFEGASSLHCFIWILPPKAADGGNDWEYPVSRKMQLELDKNEDGTYSHTIDLMNTAYDFTQYDLKIYVDYKAANTGGVIGSIYMKDIAYSVPVNLEDKNIWVTPSDNCASVVYTDGMGWKATSATEAKYYVKINSAVTTYYMEQGNNQMTLTFSSAFDGADYAGSSPLHCYMWILPKTPSGSNDWTYLAQKMAVQLDKNSDGTYSHTIDLTNTAFDFANYDVTIYIDNLAANTGKHVGSIYIKDIVYSVKAAVVEPEKANYLEGTDGESSVIYTEGKGWKVTAEPNAAATNSTCYNFYLAKEVIQYYVNEMGATKLTITVGGSFDGTSHSGNPVNCQEWIIPKTAAGSDDWSYKNGFFSGWTSLGGGKYSYTIDLTNANYNFLDSDLRIRVSYWDNGTGGLTDRMVGATYIYDIAFTA